MSYTLIPSPSDPFFRVPHLTRKKTRLHHPRTPTPRLSRRHRCRFVSYTLLRSSSDPFSRVPHLTRKKTRLRHPRTPTPLSPIPRLSRRRRRRFVSYTLIRSSSDPFSRVPHRPPTRAHSRRRRCRFVSYTLIRSSSDPFARVPHLTRKKTCLRRLRHQRAPTPRAPTPRLSHRHRCRFVSHTLIRPSSDPFSRVPHRLLLTRQRLPPKIKLTPPLTEITCKNSPTHSDPPRPL